MLWPLRYNTSSQELPFSLVSDSDGKTAFTTALANTDIKLFKAGATSEVNKNSGGSTHLSGGRHYTVLDATDTNTVGPMRVTFAPSSALQEWINCIVLPAEVYDALIAGTDYLETHAGKFTSLAGTFTLLKRDGTTTQATRTATSDGADGFITDFT